MRVVLLVVLVVVLVLVTDKNKVNYSQVWVKLEFENNFFAKLNNPESKTMVYLKKEDKGVLLPPCMQMSFESG